MRWQREVNTKVGEGWCELEKFVNHMWCLGFDQAALVVLAQLLAARTLSTKSLNLRWSHDTVQRKQTELKIIRLDLLVKTAFAASSPLS